MVDAKSNNNVVANVRSLKSMTAGHARAIIRANCANDNDAFAT